MNTVGAKATPCGARAAPWVTGVVSWAHALAFAPDGTTLPQGDAPHYLAVAAGIRNMLAEGHPGTALGMASELAPNPGWVPAWMGGWMLVFGASERVAVASLLPFHLMLAIGAWRGGRALAGHEGGFAAMALTLGALGVAHAGRVAMLDLPLAACAAVAGGLALESRPRGALLGVASACLSKLAGGPSLLALALDVLVRGWRESRGPTVRGLVACVACVAFGYAAGLGTLLEGYAGESGNVAPALRGSVGLLARAGGLAASAVDVLQPPLLILLVASLLAGRGGRPLLWSVGVLLGLVPFTLTPQARYLLPAIPFVAIAGASLLAGASRGSARALVWACALVSFVQVVALDAGLSRGVGRAGVVPIAPAPVDSTLHARLVATLARLDSHARASGHDPAMRRAVLALDLPDRPETASGVAAWEIARAGMALVPVSARAGHALREDADLALVVRCGGRAGGRAVEGRMPTRAPDRMETWPAGCVARVWEAPLRAGTQPPRSAR